MSATSSATKPSSRDYAALFRIHLEILDRYFANPTEFKKRVENTDFHFVAECKLNEDTSEPELCKPRLRPAASLFGDLAAWARRPYLNADQRKAAFEAVEAGHISTSDVFVVTRCPTLDGRVRTTSHVFRNFRDFKDIAPSQTPSQYYTDALTERVATYGGIPVRGYTGVPMTKDNTKKLSEHVMLLATAWKGQIEDADGDGNGVMHNIKSNVMEVSEVRGAADVEYESVVSMDWTQTMDWNEDYMANLLYVMYSQETDELAGFLIAFVGKATGGTKNFCLKIDGVSENEPFHFVFIEWVYFSPDHRGLGSCAVRELIDNLRTESDNKIVVACEVKDTVGADRFWRGTWNFHNYGSYDACVFN